MYHISTEFCENWHGSFYTIPLTNNCDKQTNADEHTTSLAEAISRHYSSGFWGRRVLRPKRKTSVTVLSATAVNHATKSNSKQLCYLC